MGPTISTGISQEVIEPPAISIPPSISVIDFHNDQEAQYFDFFRKETVFELAGGSQKMLFNVVTLQACHTDTSVRHAATAIAALSKAMKASKFIDRNEGEAGFQRICKSQSINRQQCGANSIIFLSSRTSGNAPSICPETVWEIPSVSSRSCSDESKFSSYTLTRFSSYLLL